MKSKDLQKLLLSKHENNDSITKIFHDLQGAISRETDSIDMSTSPGHPRVIRTKEKDTKDQKSFKTQKTSVISKTGSGTRYLENKCSSCVDRWSGTSAIQEKNCSIDDRYLKSQEKKVCKLDQNKFPERRHWKFCFPMRNCLILMEYTMLRMIMCVLWTVAKLLRTVGRNRNVNFPRKLWLWMQQIRFESVSNKKPNALEESKTRIYCFDESFIYTHWFDS